MRTRADGSPMVGAMPGGVPVNQQEKKTTMSTLRLEQLARGAVEIPLQPASWDIWDKKYRLKAKYGAPVEASIDHTRPRVAKARAAV